jgi:uncharacterized Fe-S center protein
MSKVYFIRAGISDTDELLADKIKSVAEKKGLFSFVSEKDMVAVKTHFGETNLSGYPRPVILKKIGEMIRSRNALPFLTETSTLYKGNRDNAVIHIEHAIKQGFGFENTGMSIIMADGLYGDEEIEVAINGKKYDSVRLASLVVKAQAFVCVSHFTGHLIAGFGAALKNLGMGCSSSKGKMEKHSTIKPQIRVDACTKCRMCIKWCPVQAISMGEDSAVIDSDKCIGCGECLTVCRFDAVKFNWGATYEDLQKNIVEHALGVYTATAGKGLYINILTRISKDCDCMPSYENICGDIGVLISDNPVAIDAASLDLVEKTSGKKLSEMSYNIPYRYQVDYAKEIGFCTADYELVEC